MLSPTTDSSDAAKSRLNPDSPVPLYHQLREALEATWRKKFSEHDDLPTEQDIMAQYAVSRITVRRALDEMSADGVIHRPKARGRLRWAPMRVYQQLNRLRGFFADDALASGYQPSTRVLSVSRGVWLEPNRHLNLSPQEECYRVERIHESNGQPLSHQISYIPCTVSPDLSISDLSGSLLSMLETRWSMVVTHAEQRLQARAATADEINLLKLPRHGHVFQIDRVSFASDGRALEYFEAALDIAHYEFVSMLRKEDSDDEH